MKVDTLQTSFVGGEFAPALLGRTDIAQYENACATLENMLIRPNGSTLSCPGTEYINDSKYSLRTGNDEYCVLLLHGDYTSNPKAFVDSSRSAHQVYPFGKATMSTAKSKFGGSSILFSKKDAHGTQVISDKSSYNHIVSVVGATYIDAGRGLAGLASSNSSIRLDGTNDYLQIPQNNAFNLGTEDFTLECNIRFAGGTLPNSAAIMTYISSVNNYWSFCLTGSSISFKVVEAGATTVEVLWPWSGKLGGNIDNEISIVRSSGVLSCLIYGTVISSSTACVTAIPVTTSNFDTNVLKIGRFNDGTGILDFNGWLDEVRISKGIPRYTGDIAGTFHHYPYLNDGYTSLLLDMGDSGGLSIPDSNDFNLNGIDFTIDFWANFTSLPTSSTDLYYVHSQIFNSIGHETYFKYNHPNHEFIGAFSGGNVTMQITTSTITLNEWNHYAMVAAGTGCTLYFNGISQGTKTYNKNWPGNVNNPLWIGGTLTNADRVFDGYIDEFRLSNIARWSANFTVSTTAYADILNVSESRTYGKAKLNPFIFSRTDSYIIETGETYFRFYTNGAVVSA